MTRQETIEKIRQACIASNPSILDLKFGCEVILGEDKNPVMVVGDIFIKDHRFQFVPVVINRSSTTGEQETFFPEIRTIYKIIGRPIQLSDILLAIDLKTQETKGWEWMIDSKGSFWTTDGSDIRNIAIYWKEYGLKSSEEGYKVSWNLLKPFEEQSDEVIEFISNLI